jgi:cytochrome P450
MLESIILETERLSPPETRVMRRAQQDIVLSTTLGGDGRHDVFAGHDVWLYLTGVNRDSTVFEDAERFHFDRFMHEDREDRPRGFSFGAGAKACLGADTARQIIATIADGLIEAGVGAEGGIGEQGLRGWVGWEDVPP